MRTIQLNETTGEGGILAGTGNVTLNDVRKEIENECEFFLVKSYYITADTDFIGLHNIDTSVYQRLKFRIKKPNFNGNAYLQFCPSKKGVINTNNTYFSGTYYKNSTPSGIANSSNPAYAGDATYMNNQGIVSCSTWTITATFSLPKDKVQGITVSYECIVQEVGGYTGLSRNGNLLIREGSGAGYEHWDGLALRPNSGSWGKGSGTNPDNIEVEIYQGKRTTPTKL